MERYDDDGTLHADLSMWTEAAAGRWYHSVGWALFAASVLLVVPIVFKIGAQPDYGRSWWSQLAPFFPLFAGVTLVATGAGFFGLHQRNTLLPLLEAPEAQSLEVDSAGLKVGLVALGGYYRKQLIGLGESAIEIAWDDVERFSLDRLSYSSFKKAKGYPTFALQLKGGGSTWTDQQIHLLRARLTDSQQEELVELALRYLPGKVGPIPSNFPDDQWFLGELLTGERVT